MLVFIDRVKTVGPWSLLENRQLVDALVQLLKERIDRHCSELLNEIDDTDCGVFYSRSRECGVGDGEF